MAQLTPQQKLRVLDWYYAHGRNQKAAAAHFRALPGYEKLSQGTISRWLAAETRIREAGGVREKTLKHPELEKSLTLWLQQLGEDQRARLTGKEIKKTASEVYKELGVSQEQRLELSNGWLGRFQRRHGIKLGKKEAPEERKLLAEAVAAFLAGRRGLDDVWSMETSPFYFDCSPVRTDSAKETSLAVGLALNVTGTQRLEPIFVEQSATRTGSGLYGSNAMTGVASSVFSAWLKSWNHVLVASNRQVLLLVNPSLAEGADLTQISNIRLVLLSPTLADHFRSCCAGLTKVFHTQYRQLVVQRALNALRAGVDPGVSIDELFKVTSVDAMALAKAAWQSVSSELAVCCWRKTQVFSFQTSLTDVSPVEIDAYIAIAVSEEVAKLHQALQILQQEARVRTITFACLTGDEFSRIGLEPSKCSGLSIKEIVQLVKQSTTQPVQSPNAPPPPQVVLQAQETLEAYWQQRNIPITPSILAFLQQSRLQLQSASTTPP